MTLKIQDIIDYIETWAPASLAYSYDNVGLIIGDPAQKVSRVLLVLDVTPSVIDEAIKKNVQLIIAHHPPIFKGIKQISLTHPTGYVIFKALKYNIAILAIHTNLDLAQEGVSHALAQALGLINVEPLCHENHYVEQITIKGSIDDIEHLYKKINPVYICDFFVNHSHYRNENRAILEVSCESSLISQCLKLIHSVSLNKAIYISKSKSLSPSKKYGIGTIGNLPDVFTSIETLLEYINLRLKPTVLRYTKFSGEICRIAVCGGSGGAFIAKARQQGAQIYITSDLKYHDFFESNLSFALIDAGHYSTEIVILPIIQRKLISIFGSDLLEIEITKMRTSPIHAFYNPLYI